MVRDEPLWTVDDVGRFLGVATKTVRGWQLAGRLPHLKIGGTVRFVPEEVRRWASDQAVRTRRQPDDDRRLLRR